MLNNTCVKKHEKKFHIMPAAGEARSPPPHLTSDGIPMTKPFSKRAGISPSIDQVLVHNRIYSKDYDLKGLKGLSAPPSKRLVMVGCMDARINPINAFGLNYGEAHILRNAGATVTPDVHRSLIVSTQKLGTREIMIIGHTKCGMIGLDEEGFRSTLLAKYGPHSYAPPKFYAINHLETHVQTQVKLVHDCPWIHPDAVVRGFIYDVETGLITEVE